MSPKHSESGVSRSCSQVPRAGLALLEPKSVGGEDKVAEPWARILSSAPALPLI